MARIDSLFARMYSEKAELAHVWISEISTEIESNHNDYSSQNILKNMNPVVDKKPWERMVGRYVVGYAKTEGSCMEFKSVWDTAEEAQKAYRELLKDESVECMVFVCKIVGSMDKIVRYVCDKQGLMSAKVFGIPEDRDWYHKVTKYIKGLVEKEEKKK